MKKKILFICRHNSARSKIAEAYLKIIAQEKLIVESAGFEPAKEVNPLVVEVMKEEGVDLSKEKPKSVFQLFKQGKLYDHVITVCPDFENNCPIFPGITKRWRCPFPDPAMVAGSYEEKLYQVRKIRDIIRISIENPGSDDFNYKDYI